MRFRVEIAIVAFACAGGAAFAECAFVGGCVTNAVQDAPFPLAIVECVYPDASFTITDHGARPDGSKCTEAFRKAMAACSAAGGGHVVVPRGRWTTGAVHFRSNCDLHLEDGAEVVFTQDPDDYLPAVFTSWEGMECWNYSPLVYAFECENVSISGKGTLLAYEGEWTDSAWFPWVSPTNGVKAARLQLYAWGATDVPVERREIWKMENAHTRPHFVQFNRCRNVRIEDVRVRNSPFWTIHLYQCEDAVVRGVDVYARGNNSDGIDIEMSRNVLVENCVFDQGDDSFVVKSGRNRDAWRLAKPTENVVFRGCHLNRAHSFLCIGSEISGGVKNICMRDCSVRKADRLCYVKTNHRRGGAIDGIWFSNVKAGAVGDMVSVETDVLYEWADFPDYETRITEIRNIFVEDVSCDSAEVAVKLKGDLRSPPKGVHFKNVSVGRVGRDFCRAENVQDVSFDGVRIGEQ